VTVTYPVATAGDPACVRACWLACSPPAPLLCHSAVTYGNLLSGHWRISEVENNLAGALE